MAAWFTAQVAGRGVAAITFAGLLLVTALLIFLTLGRAAEIADRARRQAVAERDAFWTAEIERANAAAARKVAEQTRAALDIEAAARERISAAEDQFAELERENASLPDGDRCGLGRDRIRLLQR